MEPMTTQHGIEALGAKERIEVRPELGGIGQDKYDIKRSNAEAMQQELVDGSSLSPVMSLPAPVVGTAVQAAQTANTTVQLDDNPIVANDDDLIEKDWVERAKRIIAETRDDPYRRELEIGRLQADYLKKRYGRVVGEV